MSDVKLIEQNNLLLKSIKNNLIQIKNWYETATNKWGEEDYIYRYYHQSFKVSYLQEHILSAVKLFKSIHNDLNEDFMDIIKAGTPGDFDLKWNKNWSKYALPITTAYFHCKYFVEQMINYGETLEEAPSLLPSGWAAVLYLFNQR